MVYSCSVCHSMGQNGLGKCFLSDSNLKVRWATCGMNARSAMAQKRGKLTETYRELVKSTSLEWPA